MLWEFVYEAALEGESSANGKLFVEEISQTSCWDKLWNTLIWTLSEHSFSSTCWFANVLLRNRRNAQQTKRYLNDESQMTNCTWNKTLFRLLSLFFISNIKLNKRRGKSSSVLAFPISCLDKALSASPFNCENHFSLSFSRLWSEAIEFLSFLLFSHTTMKKVFHLRRT